MESDTTEKESTASSLEPTTATASAEMHSPRSESAVGSAGVGEGAGKKDKETSVREKCDGEATPPPTKRQKIANEQDESVDEKAEKKKELVDDEGEAPQLVERVERVQSTQSSLRSFNRIPVFIVDYHNDVLEFVYRCLATRHLPLERNILVHFDSHPDMVVARDIPASASYDKDIMLNELSIENWIMPTLYAGKAPMISLQAFFLTTFPCRSLRPGRLAEELVVPADSHGQT